MVGGEGLVEGKGLVGGGERFGRRECLEGGNVWWVDCLVGGNVWWERENV